MLTFKACTPLALPSFDDAVINAMQTRLNRSLSLADLGRQRQLRSDQLVLASNEVAEHRFEPDDGRCDSLAGALQDPQRQY